ncbi:MAG: hypothetical protein DRQ47_08650 [Gammaproteobacteria bacterium]|nr:MAG: hypothetical protein DRQ47_08650 [Gammaproteobacteria bacterium]
METIAITGASGLIGKRLVEELLRLGGVRIKVLLRQNREMTPGIEIVVGDLTSDGSLRKLLDGVDTVFHCAAELHDESAMGEVNVLATKRLAQLAVKKSVACFIHVSSAGVVGPSKEALINEETPCHPRNAYEVSKWRAEQALEELSRNSMRLYMIRPTNVIDVERPGLLSMALRDRWQERIKAMIKGGECAHLVHAIDVAAAAVHLARSPMHPEGVYCVSCDEDERNTVAGVLGMCRATYRTSRASSTTLHFPASVPYWLRRGFRGESLHGASRFSSAKLVATGFSFPLGLDGGIEMVCSCKRRCGQ